MYLTQKKLIKLLIVLIFIKIDYLFAGEAQLNFVVLANRGHQEAYAKWKPLADYLQLKTNHKVNLKPYSFTQLEDALANKNVDLLLINPLQFVQYEEKYKIRILATLKTRNAPYICGVIITRKDSGINKIQDIAGKKVAIVSKDSLGGYLSQCIYLMTNGLSANMGCQIWVAENAENVIYAVYNKAYDVGFVSGDVWDEFVKNKIYTDDLTVLNPRKEKNFPYICTTDLWPNWAIAASANLKDDIIKKISQALLNIENDPLAMEVKHSFSPPVDYSKVKKVDEILKGLISHTSLTESPQNKTQKKQ